MQNSAKHLLAEIEAFLKQHEMPATAFGIASVNDGHLVRRLRDGKGTTLARFDKVKAYIAQWEREHKKLRVA